MNREIKFRALATEDVQEDWDIYWVYGIYLDGFIVNEVIEATNEYIALGDWCPVQKETVGQFTGLKDKNGKEIYEGDILEAENRLWQIGFRDGCFVGVDFKNVAWDELVNIGYGETKVIGNIHDNPELIN